MCYQSATVLLPSCPAIATRHYHALVERYQTLLNRGLVYQATRATAATRRYPAIPVSPDEVTVGGEVGERNAEQADNPDTLVCTVPKGFSRTCTAALQQNIQSSSHLVSRTLSLETRGKILLIICVCTNAGSVCPVCNYIRLTEE